jgi:hypothetical protein
MSKINGLDFLYTVVAGLILWGAFELFKNYGPVVYDALLGKSALEKCADQNYSRGAVSIKVDDELKKKMKSLHYQDVYQSCEREQKTTPSAFKLKYVK